MKGTIATAACVLGFSIALGASPQSKPVDVRPALLVIDVQNAFLPDMDEQDRKQGLDNINAYIAQFRRHDMPVIRIYHTDPQGGPKPGTEPFEFSKTIQVNETDPRVIKNYGNAFNKTNLDKLLKDKGVNTVFLCGLSATACVLATYHGAEDLDYNVFMLKDALLSDNAEHTKTVQQFCKTASFSALKLILDLCRR